MPELWTPQPVTLDPVSPRYVYQSEFDDSESDRGAESRRPYGRVGQAERCDGLTSLLDDARKVRNASLHLTGNLILSDS